MARAAREHGAERLTLSAFAGNTAARRLYARLGFVEVDAGVRIKLTKPLN